MASPVPGFTVGRFLSLAKRQFVCVCFVVFSAMASLYLDSQSGRDTATLRVNGTRTDLMLIVFIP